MSAEITGTDASLLAEPDFRPLDARVIRLWRLGYLIGFGIILLCLLPLVVVAWLREFDRAEFYVVLWLLLLGFAIWYSLWRPNRAYAAWGYRIDAKTLETKSGVWFRVMRLLPLNRLQHVDLHRGPLERLFGLASLVLYTAGTSSASISIPGLSEDEAVRMRDHLVAIGGDDAV
jgi:membrane protein YdbS with pleckstrin-like domain